MGIEVRGLTKAFGSFVALKDVSLRVASGELVALLGPSGSGKTTLLRIIAGLEEADSGSVLLEGEDATARNARERGVGFVFQHYALFRHMTVFENVAFGLRVRPRARRPDVGEIKTRVRRLLELVQLDFMADRRPSELSGGQRQRVALARALAVEPKVLLLDEPFGALDAKVRMELRQWLRRLHDDIHLTSVFVTHDQEEALELADRVAVMNHGVIVQEGTPDDVVERPATPFVISFLGTVNVFHGRVEAGRGVFGPLAVDYPVHTDDAPRNATAYTKPHEFDVSRSETGGGLWTILEESAVAGAMVKLELAVPDGPSIRAELGRDQFERLGIEPGDRVYVTPRKVRVFVD
ncbi:MAG: sulfate ABC transporter ATP-binding protein [Acidobacteriota bacterium]